MGVSIAGREVFNNSQINSGDINNPDIDGGTIDGTVIGGSSAAAGKFTSLEAQTAKVTGGTPGVGKILTSDAVGNASWENAPVPDSGTTANLPLVSDGAHGYSIASRDIRDIANLARVPNQGVAMTSATSGSNGITVADNDNIDFGTGNYTLVWKGSIPDWTPSSAVVLIQKTDGTNGWILQVATSGVLQLVRNAEAAKSSTAAPSITDGTTHEIVCVVTTETASVAGSVVFYVDGVQLGDTVTITAGSPTTVSNSAALYVAGTSSTRSASTTYHAYTFNRALTAAEVLDLYRNGISYADQWGSQTALTSGTLTTGKKYRINTYVSDDDFTNIGAASNASGVEFTATGTTPTHWAHSSSLVEIGATLALEPEGVYENNKIWVGSSTNNLHGYWPTTGAWAIRSSNGLPARIMDCENIIEDLSYYPPVTFTWDPGSLADGVGETSAAVSVPGVSLGGAVVQCIAPYDLQGVTLNAYVDAADSCKARLQNETTGTIDLASGTWIMQARRI